MDSINQMFADLEGILEPHSTFDEKARIAQLKVQYETAKRYGVAGVVVAPIALVGYAMKSESLLGRVLWGTICSLGVLSYVHGSAKTITLERELSEVHEEVDKRLREYQISRFSEQPQSRVYDFDEERKRRV